ncbi:hypothetical protein SH2C18_15430 [Clostridium sediminicola]|uniref:hypothetical protein n=1 Tax=Clostridium sediminicola TaxID=3114879 RepID=UPI0031F25D24
MFLHREKEEFYDFENDPNALVNLIDNKEYKDLIDKHKKYLFEDMKRSNDPKLKEFENIL